MPAFGMDQQIRDQRYRVGAPIEWKLPNVDTLGTPPHTYSLTGTIPTGLSFDENTRILSGTPTAVAESPVELMYSVTDSNNDVARIPINITVLSSPNSIETIEVDTPAELRSIADPDNDGIGFTEENGTYPSMVVGISNTESPFSLTAAQSLAADYRQTADINLCSDPSAAGCKAFTPIGRDNPAPVDMANNEISYDQCESSFSSRL